jgi:hypothetical protein
MNEKICGPNYEEEYQRKCDEIEKAKCEIDYWKTRCEEVEKEHKYCMGVLRTVEVIFGRNFNNG